MTRQNIKHTSIFIKVRSRLSIGQSGRARGRPAVTSTHPLVNADHFFGGGVEVVDVLEGVDAERDESQAAEK